MLDNCDTFDVNNFKNMSNKRNMKIRIEPYSMYREIMLTPYISISYHNIEDSEIMLTIGWLGYGVDITFYT